MADITYCINALCPFKDCERHLSHIRKGEYVSVANFDGVCRRYIGHLVDEAEKGEIRMGRLIDADALMRDINETVIFSTRPDRSSAEMCGARKVIERIEAAPTADVVEVKHGRWKISHNPIDDPKGYFIRIVCSECGLKTGQVSNYCPNCGAKMDGGKNER